MVGEKGGIERTGARDERVMLTQSKNEAHTRQNERRCYRRIKKGKKTERTEDKDEEEENFRAVYHDSSRSGCP